MCKPLQLVSMNTSKCLDIAHAHFVHIAASHLPVLDQHPLAKMCVRIWTAYMHASHMHQSHVQLRAVCQQYLE
jgi:hypothetical protein